MDFVPDSSWRVHYNYFQRPHTITPDLSRIKGGWFELNIFILIKCLNGICSTFIMDSSLQLSSATPPLSLDPDLSRIKGGCFQVDSIAV